MAKAPLPRPGLLSGEPAQTRWNERWCKLLCKLVAQTWSAQVHSTARTQAPAPRHQLMAARHFYAFSFLSVLITRQVDPVMTILLPFYR